MKPLTPEYKDSLGIETRDKLKDVYHTCKSKGATNMRRREERAEERRGGPSGGAEKTHYQMREKLVSIGDDFSIENNRGEKVYKVDGKALRVRQTMIFEDRVARSWPRSRNACCASRTAWKSKIHLGVKWLWSRKP